MQAFQQPVNWFGLHQRGFGVALLETAVTGARRLAVGGESGLPGLIPIFNLQKVDRAPTLAVIRFFERTAGVG
jgi:hypothetical protein